MVTTSPWYGSVRAIALVASLLVGHAASAQSEGATRAANANDLVVLQNGNEFEGTIVADADTSLTIRIAHGQELEIAKSMVSKIVRRSHAIETDAKEGTTSYWDGRNAWFHLRDELGRHIGKMHYYVRSTEDGGAQLEEQWTFVNEGRKSFMSRIEVLDANRAPVSFVFREAVSKLADERVLRERLVRGEVEDASLRIVEAGTDGRSTRTVPFPAGNSFPLAVAESVRRGESDGAHEYAASIYDPLDGVFELRRYELQDGVPAPRKSNQVARTTATLIESKEHGRTRREWIATDGSILLVEVNGIHLVAEPVSEATAIATATYGRLIKRPRVATLGDLDVFLPRATWQLGRTVERGHCIELVPPIDVHVRVRWVEGDTTGTSILQSASESMLTAFRIDHESFRETGQELRLFDGRPGLEIRGIMKDRVGHQIDVVHWMREQGSGWVVVTLEGDRRQVARVSDEARDLVGDICESTRNVASNSLASPSR
ncbi:MAG: hypothetical protein KDC95_12610 [Planctomycetes bacterium]|nr:hypothetical protein [Planctomycetota bacterium]